MKTYTLVFGLIFTGVLFLVSGCMEDPNPVGAHLLPQEDIISAQVDTFYAVSGSPSRRFPAYGEATRILFGIHNSASTEAWAWVKFGQIPDSVRGLPLVEASLLLKGAYSLGTTSEPLTYTLHKALKNWIGETSTDSLTLETIEAGGYYEPAGSSGVLPSQPDTNLFSLRLDTALVRQWIDAVADTNMKNYGVVIKPGNSQLIRGFRSFREPAEELRPALMIVYRKSATDVDTAYIRTGEDRFLARVTSTAWMTDSTTISVRNGVSYRGVLDFSNVVLPKNYAVHQAILEVQLKDSTFLNSYSTHSLYAYFISTTGTVESLVEASQDIAGSGPPVYRIVVSSFVHFWGRSGSERKIAVGGATEKNTIDIFGLHGTASSNRMARPKLIITYTEFK